MKISTVAELDTTLPAISAKSKGSAVEAAKQFESLLIGQILKSMHEGSSGWLGSGEDQAAESAMGMAEEHFAKALSQSGGLGLAATIQHGLESPRRSQKFQD